MKTKNAPPVMVPSFGDTVRTNTGAEDGVVLRGIRVSLDTEAGRIFVTDCARNIEDLMTDQEIKIKYGLTDDEWESLAINAPLLKAVRAAREDRIFNGECAREAARLHFAKAPDVLNDILTDQQIAPRHRIEAARELRQAADSGPDTPSGAGERHSITIIIGDEKILIEGESASSGPSWPDDGEEP